MHKGTEGVEVYVCSLLSSAVNKGCGLHTPNALPPGKETTVPIREEIRWASGLVLILWRRERNHSTHQRGGWVGIRPGTGTLKKGKKPHYPPGRRLGGHQAWYWYSERGKETTLPIREEVGWASGLVLILWKRERNHTTHQGGGWVGIRPGTDTLKNIKSTAPARNEVIHLSLQWQCTRRLSVC